MARKLSVVFILLVFSLSIIAAAPTDAIQLEPEIPLWAWILFGVALAAMIGLAIWWMGSRPIPRSPEPGSPARTRPSDLERIEGITPQISSILNSRGISTFKGLASTDTEALRLMLREAGIDSLPDPSTWPQQAELADQGNWSELKAFQERIKGEEGS